MTIALGINFGNYIFLAADTRTCYYDCKGKMLDFCDDSIKITNTRIGLITGAGDLGLLNSVKKRFKVEEPDYTDKILNIIKSELSMFADRLEEKMVEYTRWILSYRTVLNNNYKLRLALYSPSEGHKLQIVEEENVPLIIFPYEAKEEEVKLLFDFFKEEIKPFKEFNNLSDSIKYHTEKTGMLIELVHPKYSSISRFFQVGIHTLDALCGISTIIDIKKHESISIQLTPYYEEIN